MTQEQIPSEIERLRIENNKLREENKALKEENARLKNGSKKPETKVEREAELDKIIELANKDYNFVNSGKPLTCREDWKENSLHGVYGEKIFRAGCVNSMERRRDGNTPAEFRQDNAGDLTIVEQQGKFIGLPRPGRTYQQHIHEYGASNEILDISPKGDKYDPKKVYKIVELIKPAIFSKDESGKLILIEKGEIVLEEKY